MTREEMIEVLIPELVHAGATFATARRRLWGMSKRQMERELLLRGLRQYDEPPELDEDEELLCPVPAALGWSCAPVYLD